MEMRKAILAQRAALSLPSRQAANEAISKQVLALGGFRDAQCVLAYMSFAAELSTAEIIRAVLDGGKVLVLPKINKAENVLELFRVADIDADLVPGPWGILQPDPRRCAKTSPKEIDFVLVPGLAFDADCHRLGYGAGYYDRLLKDLRPFATFVAGAFALQIVERVPVEAHDISLDVVVTENQKYTCNGFLNQK